MRFFTLITFGLFIWLAGCNYRKNSNQAVTDKLQPVDIRNPVEIMVLKPTTFQKELISNGKLIAHRKSVLKFYIGEELTALNVKNGDRVEKGQVIARLRQDKLKQALKQAEIQQDRAELEMKDILIMQGFRLEDSVNIPAGIFESARLRSGYTSAIHEVENARVNLQNSVLVAPFSGVVANIGYKIHEQVSTSEEFCTLIDNSFFEVEFAVLEAELQDISLNKPVKISPFVRENDIYAGVITEINPVVDENGHIMVKALVRNTTGLMEGMNVKVKIETAVPDQLVVPKSAVVQRQNQEVLFKYKNGIAFWTYVQTLYENSTSYAVIAHPDKGGTLMPGDTVIISGNLNLAHESEVVIEK
jgi:membrane fusion protein (multidrug efflux system)